VAQVAFNRGMNEDERTDGRQ